MSSKSQTAAIRGEDRREVLLRTAETLFATKGIDAVSLNEINKAAGQKNTSALHYHFGSKDKLIEAIIYHEFDDIISQLNNGFDALEAKGEFSQLELLKVITAPFIGKLDSERGNNYLRIMAQLLDRNANMPFYEQPENVEQVRQRAFDLAEPYYRHLPLEVLVPRLIMFSTLLFRSLVSYIQFKEVGSENLLGDKQTFISVLLEGLERMIFAPLSEETLKTLEGQE